MALQTAEDTWEPGDIVIDSDGNIAQKKVANDGWLVLGWIDDTYRYTELALPVRRLVPAPAPVGKPDSPDTRIFRLTRQYGGYGKRSGAWEGHVEYCGRISASQKCGAGGHSRAYGSVVRVEATNADATAGWTDVSEEFLGVQVQGDVL